MENLTPSLALLLDLLAPDTVSHHLRVILVAVNLAGELGVSDADVRKLFYASQFHDIGVASSRDKLNIMKFAYVDNQPHCEMGAALIRESEVLGDLSLIIGHHHDRWLGPNKSGAIKDNIPVMSHIIYLADRMSVLIFNSKYVLEQKAGILNKIKRFSGTFFNPELVEALVLVSRNDGFWLDLTPDMIEHQLSYFTPPGKTAVSPDQAVQIAHIFESAVDSKSHYSTPHCKWVRELSVRLAGELGFKGDELKEIEIAASLHDLGKLSVSDEILEKPSSLTSLEYSIKKARLLHL